MASLHEFYRTKEEKKRAASRVKFCSGPRIRYRSFAEEGEDGHKQSRTLVSFSDEDTLKVIACLWCLCVVCVVCCLCCVLSFFVPCIHHRPLPPTPPPSIACPQRVFDPRAVVDTRPFFSTSQFLPPQPPMFVVPLLGLRRGSCVLCVCVCVCVCVLVGFCSQCVSSRRLHYPPP